MHTQGVHFVADANVASVDAARGREHGGEVTDVVVTLHHDGGYVGVVGSAGLRRSALYLAVAGTGLFAVAARLGTGAAIGAITTGGAAARGTTVAAGAAGTVGVVAALLAASGGISAPCAFGDGGRVDNGAPSGSLAAFGTTSGKSTGFHDPNLATASIDACGGLDL